MHIIIIIYFALIEHIIFCLTGTEVTVILFLFASVCFFRDWHHISFGLDPTLKRSEMTEHLIKRWCQPLRGPQVLQTLNQHTKLPNNIIIAVDGVGALANSVFLYFSFVKWVKKHNARPGMKMDLLQKYMKRRDSEMVPESPSPGRNQTYLCFGFYCFDFFVWTSHYLTVLNQHWLKMNDENLFRGNLKKSLNLFNV